MRPGLAVDSGAGGYVADAEFGGQLPVGHAFGSACPQLSDFLVGQLGPGVTLADCAVIGAVAFAAPWLEPDPDVVARGIDRRPVLGRFPAVNTCVTAGWAAGFVNALVPYVIGRVYCLPGGSSQLVSACAGAASVVAPDHGECSADRAMSLLIFGLAARASARLRTAGLKGGNAGRGFLPAVAPAEGRPVAFPVR